MSLDRRIQDHLIDTGAMTEQRVTHTPRPRHCRHCGLAVIAAIDDLGFESVCDPHRLTKQGELEALMHGRWTFAINPYGGGMYARRARQIMHRPADEEYVYAAHKCGADPLHHYPPETNQSVNYDDDPPF